MRPKKSAHASQSTLFLIELILSVAFMAFASVVCVRLYLYAHTISEESSSRTHAITEVQNVFAGFQAGDGTLQDTIRKYRELASTELVSAEDASRELSSGTTSSERASVGTNSTAATNLSPANEDSSSATLLFDKDWRLVDETAGKDSAPAFRMILTLSEDPDTPGMAILTADVRNDLLDPDQSIYTAEWRQYHSPGTEKGGAAE